MGALLPAVLAVTERQVLAENAVGGPTGERPILVGRRLEAFLLLRPQGVLQMATLAIGE